MAMTALFRGKWGQKTREPLEKRPAALVQASHEEDEDEDDPDHGTGRGHTPIRRNSRFYRSMRKKRLPPSEQPECKKKKKHFFLCPENAPLSATCHKPGIQIQIENQWHLFFSGRMEC